MRPPPCGGPGERTGLDALGARPRDLGVLLALSLAGWATAAPIPGAQFTQFTMVSDPPTFFVGPSGFLPNASCGLDVVPFGGSRLTADVRGWQLQVGEPPALERESFTHADVHGTVTDRRGNVYRLDGAFAESGIVPFPDFVLPFDGVGHVTIAGPAGVVSGTAEFRVVLEAPPEWDLIFSDIAVCDLR